MVGWGRSGHGIFHEGRCQTGRVLSPQQLLHTRALADVRAAKLELRNRRAPARTGRQMNRLDSDCAGLDRMLYRTALESGNCDRRIGIGCVLGARTDLLDNGLTESLTHGEKDFLGGLWTGRGWWERARLVWWWWC